MKQLSGTEILERLIKFNETNDWTVFGDVPESQQVSVMYPHMLPQTLEYMKEYLEEQKQLETSFAMLHAFKERGLCKDIVKGCGL